MREHLRDIVSSNLYGDKFYLKYCGGEFYHGLHIILALPQNPVIDAHNLDLQHF